MRHTLSLLTLSAFLSACSSTTVITPVGNFSYEPSVLPVVGLESSGGGLGMGAGDQFLKVGSDVYVETDRNIKNLHVVAAQFLPKPVKKDEVNTIGKQVNFSGWMTGSRFIQNATLNESLLMPNEAESLTQQNELTLMTMCVYGEARGEEYEGKLAVAQVIMNRVKEGGWYGGSIKDVVLKPYQFSCFNTWDPNLKKMFDPDLYLWKQCFKAAWNAYSEIMNDPTQGATHYCTFQVNPPWIRAMQETGQIGNHRFFKTSESALLEWWMQTAQRPGPKRPTHSGFESMVEYLRIYSLIEPKAPKPRRYQPQALTRWG